MSAAPLFYRGAPSGEIAASGAAVVEREFPCAGCEYDLRGLSSDGRCPECGASVGESLRCSTLHHADPQWLGRMIVAGWLVPAGIGVMVLLMMLDSLLPVASSPMTRAIVNAGTGLAGELALFAGPLVLLLTPTGRFLHRPMLRRLALLGIGVMIVAELAVDGLGIAMSIIGNSPDFAVGGRAQYDALSRGMRWVGIVSNFGAAAGLSLPCFYAAILLRRVPRTSLAWWFTVAGGIIGTGFGSVAMLIFIDHLGGIVLGVSLLRSTAPEVGSAVLLVLAVCAYGGILFAMALAPLASLRLRHVRRTAIRLRTDCNPAAVRA